MAREHRPIELTKTLEHVKVPSMVSDRRGTITWMNGAARRLFGDLLGRPFTTVVAPECVSLVERQLARKLRGTPVTDYQVEVLTADGTRIRADVSSVPIAGGNQCHAIFGVALPRATRGSDSPAKLTARQTEVLQLLGQGASTDDIALSLHLSKETVRNHIRHILRALSAHSRLEAVAIAHRSGLLSDQ